MKSVSFKVLHFLVPAMFAFPLLKENLVTFVFLLTMAAMVIWRISHRDFKISKPRILWFSIPFFIVLTDFLIRGTEWAELAPTNRAAFFLLFPILFAFLPDTLFERKRIEYYLQILKYSCAAMAITYVALFLVYYDFQDFFRYQYDIPKFRDFVYHETPVFRIHPTYYTSVVLFVTAFSFDKVLKHRKYSELIFVAIFVLITFMVLAKLNIVLLIILLGYMLVFRSGLNRFGKISAIFSFLVLISVLIATVPGISRRFQEMLKSYDRPPVGVAYDSTNVRLAIVKCSTILLDHHYLKGLGFNNVGDELNQCYAANYDSDFYKKDGYLTHNYYMYIFLGAGLLGFLIFVGYTALIGVTVVQMRTFLCSVSCLNVFILCFTEDFLYRQYGIFYFSLIFFTFLKAHEREKMQLSEQPLA